jgi:Flp pilus assembly protein TadD
VASERRIRIQQIEQQAEGYLELGMSQQALDVLARLGNSDQYTPKGLYLWGEALRNLGRYQEALVPLERAAQASPENIHIRLALGWCHKRNSQLDLAIQDIRTALRTEPSESLLHYNLACYLSLAGEKKPALMHLALALRMDSHYRELIDSEPDFDPLRSDPDFQALTNLIV